MTALLKKGTLVEFHSWGNTYRGFIVGTCCYDLYGEDNGYVVRYVWRKQDDAPRKPYTIVGVKRVEPIKDFPEDFYIGDHYSATPDDRCNDWGWVRDEETGHLIVVGKVSPDIVADDEDEDN